MRGLWATAIRSFALSGLTVAVSACGGSAESPFPGNPSGPTLAAAASISLSPSSATLAPGEQIQPIATVRDAAGNALTTYAAVWASSDANIARIPASGPTVTAVAVGQATITASVQSQPSIRASMVVTVALPSYAGRLYIGAQRRPFTNGPLSYEIVSVDLATGAETNLTRSPTDESDPVVSPDGQFVEFTGFLNGAGYIQPLVASRDGTGTRRAYSGCRTENLGLGSGSELIHCVQSPGWLSDSRLAFLVVDATPTVTANAMLTDARTGVGQTLPLAASLFRTIWQFREPFPIAFSPSGNQLAYQDAGALSVVNASTGVRTQIGETCTFLATCKRPPIWAPSGQFIYVIQEGKVIRVAPDGSSPRTIHSDAGITEMTISPDGTQLAILEGGVIKVLNSDGTGTARTFEVARGNLAWSPDSKAIAYTVAVRDNPLVLSPDAVVVVRSDGTGRRKFADVPDGARGLSWGR